MERVVSVNRLGWWKWACMILLGYTFLAGLLAPVPRLPILQETIRNLHFHVPLYFAMIVLLGYSVYASIKVLQKGADIPHYDAIALGATETGFYFGILGLATGMIWAKYTWGEMWSGDPKQNATAVGMLIYGAYFVFRSAFQSEEKRAKLSAVYNILAYAVLIPLLFILPRMTDSLHPGNGGNPGFNSYDLDSGLRMVFYPAVAGWILLGLWISNLRVRMKRIENRLTK